MGEMKKENSKNRYPKYFSYTDSIRFENRRKIDCWRLGKNSSRANKKEKEKFLTEKNAVVSSVQMNPLIDARDLGKIYTLGKVSVPALLMASFQIKEGEFIAIMGPSGSGKSTLMNLLGCLDTPTTGIYKFDDINVNTLDSDELANIRNSRIGFVFQSFNLLPRATALENIELPLIYARISNSEKLAQASLEKVGLGHRGSHRPVELSGGERQRVAIARAIVNKPALILADEPTGNLDSIIGEEILDIFNALNLEGVTIVLVTHEKQVAERARRTIQMKDGKIISDTNI